MDITITITNPTPAVLRLLAGDEALSPKTSAKTASPAPKGKTAAEPAAAQSPASDAAEASPPATEETVDIALLVKTRAQEVAAKNGRDLVADLIKKSGGTAGISTIPEANREDFIAACDAALAE